MEQDKFNELLMSILAKWDEAGNADAILNDNTGDLELSEENQKIFNLICERLDQTRAKMMDLQDYVGDGGTREEWLDDIFTAAVKKANLTEEEIAKVNEMRRQAYEHGATAKVEEVGDTPAEAVETTCDDTKVNNINEVKTETL